jgi:hypothetical protein
MGGSGRSARLGRQPAVLNRDATCFSPQVFVYDDQNFPAYLPEHPKLDGVSWVEGHDRL